MKRSGAVKFPNSVQLFKFCQKIMSIQQGLKVNDQEIGAILEFNPSDCSHWKRGEKNVRSVFSLGKLAKALNVEPALINDLAAGSCDLDEAYFEFCESKTFKNSVQQSRNLNGVETREARLRIEAFVQKLHQQSEFTTPPFYLPEIMRYFSFITTQPQDMVDRLSRVLRTKPNHYCIQFRKGELRAQTRLSLAKDFGRIILEAERNRFPELGAANPAVLPYEVATFYATLLVPKAMLLEELAKLDARRNVVVDLAALFWVPKSLVGYQLQEIVRLNEHVLPLANVTAAPNAGEKPAASASFANL
jgi:hypothetical protein